MKICFISHPDSPHTRRWINWFIHKGYEGCLIADAPQQQPWPGIPVFNLPAIINTPVVRYLIWEIWLKQFLGCWKPDILHAHRVSSAGWLGAFSGFHPFVVTPWGTDLYQHPYRSRVARWLALYTLRHADLVTANSQDLRRQAIRFGANPNFTHVIRWGIDFKHFHPVSESKAQKESLGLSNKSVILSPRALRPIYNIDILVQAMPQVLSVIPNAILILRDYNADINYRTSLQAKILEMGLSHAVKWLGPIYPWENNASSYHLADLVVSIATTDSTSSSVLEAMACGVPVIVSDIPALREWIIPGYNGFLVSPHDAKALADAIITLLQNPRLRSQFAQRALQVVLEHADQETEMQKMETLYRNLLSRP